MEHDNPRPVRITERELGVMWLVAHGFQDAEIAKLLGRSPATIHVHVANVLGKLHAHSRAQAVYQLTRAGLLR